MNFLKKAGEFFENFGLKVTLQYVSYKKWGNSMYSCFPNNFVE